MPTSRRIFLVSACLPLLAACNGGSSSGGVVQPPPPPADPDIALQQVFAAVSLAAPVSLEQAPGDDTRWFAVEQGGRIRVFDNDTAAASTEVFLDISARVVSGGERGLFDLAFHPAFPATPEVYVSYTGAPGGALTSLISRFTTDAGGTAADPATEEVLLAIEQPASNHNGGQIEFGPDGRLYAGFGDGGGAGDPNDNAQNVLNLLGTIVRIDVDAATPYSIPPGNPFAGELLICRFGPSGSPCPEIFAWGFRNPWRFSFDEGTGLLWAGDVGQGSWEEVDIVMAGGNYGWDVREGAHCFEPPSGCSTAGLTDPVTEYSHSLGQSITGGFVYRGTAIPELFGYYVFGDFISGRIFAIDASSQPGVTPTELLDTDLSISTFAEGDNGELYVIDYANGDVFRIVDAP